MEECEGSNVGYKELINKEFRSTRLILSRERVIIWLKTFLYMKCVKHHPIVQAGIWKLILYNMDLNYELP